MQVQQLETPAGKVKRYSRPEDAAAPPATAAATSDRHSADRAAVMAARRGARRKPPPTTCCVRPIRSKTTAIASAPARSMRVARARLAARHAGAPAAAILARAQPPNAAATPRWDISPAMPTAGPRTSARRWRRLVLGLIEDPRFGPVFAPGSRAEVSIVGRLERPGQATALVSGQIDRLVVTPGEVLIVDYKTNHAPPQAGGRGACRLCPPARALPRGARQALSRAAGPRRPALDRNA